jgi:hypothetical protein
MLTFAAISLTWKKRKEKHALTLFSRAFFPGGMRLTQQGKLTAPRGILA